MSERVDEGALLIRGVPELRHVFAHSRLNGDLCQWSKDDSLTIRGRTFKVGERVTNGPEKAVCRSPQSSDDTEFICLGLVSLETLEPLHTRMRVENTLLNKGGDPVPWYAIFAEATGAGFRIVKPGEVEFTHPIQQTNWKALLANHLNVETVEFGQDLVTGGKTFEVSDESFASARNLLKVHDPTFSLGRFNPKAGQIMDSWETERHNEEPPDFAEIGLGTPGKIGCVVIDTAWHDGNQAPEAGLMASKDGVNWVRLMDRTPLDGHSLHVFQIDNPEQWRYVKLENYPDGGISRLRLYSEVPEVLQGRLDTPIVVRHPEEIKKAEKEAFQYPNADAIAKARAEVKPGQILQLTSSRLGAKIAATSNERYSHAGNVLKDDDPENMGDGWENARKRVPFDQYETLWDSPEWVVIELSDRGTIDQIMTDFRYFNFNNPRDIEVEGCDLLSGQPLEEAEWQTVVSRRRSKQFRGQSNVKLPCTSGSSPFTHLRVRIYPDGGAHRIRAMGHTVQPNA